MEYDFRKIEKYWQEKWTATQAYKVSNESKKPKYYVLDMFPYPSGAGLHVGHPLGYIASDIFARYKRLKGYNVLHPMGYDAFGLPAEQYALDHGIHPAASTAENILNFRKQLDNIGFCYDWSRELKTSDPSYYKWTQWIFLKLFNSYFNRKTGKAAPITELVNIFQQEGNQNHPIPNSNFQLRVTGTGPGIFQASDWNDFGEKLKSEILMEYRLAYCGYGEVNWCEALGTVLANDEVINGLSERGGYPVIKKKLRQWYLRITEYADRLLDGLQTVDFSDAMKEMQTNWIGKSFGAEISFAIRDHSETLKVYTTRPDTIFGVDFMVIAPEHPLTDQITTASRKTAVEEYIGYVRSRSERERQAEKKISGCFTGAYAINPFDNREIPIWISEYVLAGYGTGAIMAVPCGDERDFRFAKFFNIPITNIIGNYFTGEQANPTKEATLENSNFLTGLSMKEATEVILSRMEAAGTGQRKVNYKMRDAAFSRQRYWGEPFPIRWKDGIAVPLEERELPLELPYVESYRPGPDGEGPLANVENWVAQDLETNTMPGYAGSSWYFLRYMDPHNPAAFCNRKASDYWNQVDLYIGGTEHAVGHLLYSRMWTKFLFDLGYIGFEEPFKKLVNQGMIQGSSRFVYRVGGTRVFVSEGYMKRILAQKEEHPGSPDPALIGEINRQLTGGIYFDESGYFLDGPGKGVASLGEPAAVPAQLTEIIPIRVDVNFVDGTELNTEAFKKWRNGEYATAEFVCENGRYLCGSEVEKMSKSKFNTVNPNELVEKYGADTFRMYEMFLGPVEQSKPWDTKGIEGVHRFLRKLWRLFFDETKGSLWKESKASAEELKVLHRAIKKIEEDTERFSFNTAVSAFMVCVNELTELKCSAKEILEPLLVMLTPYAPHIAEELWKELGNQGSILDENYPAFEAGYLTESTKEYPVSINGKMRTTIVLAVNADQDQVEKQVLSHEIVKKWVAGNPVKKFIFVKGKMINIVV